MYEFLVKINSDFADEEQQLLDENNPPIGQKSQMSINQDVSDD